MKLCIDCKHYKSNKPRFFLSFGGRSPTCLHPKAIDLVTGKSTAPSCYAERNGEWMERNAPKHCGVEGRNFEAKQ